MNPKRTIAGPDLKLAHGPARELNLYTATGRPLGSFARARDAWAVVDALDTGLPVDAELPEAA